MKNTAEAASADEFSYRGKFGYLKLTQHTQNNVNNGNMIYFLQAELADVLRKRRNRPDASGSEEDLGLPRSPTTPQRNEGKIANHSEVSSLSQLSMRSSELDEDLSSTHYNITSESMFAERTVSSSVSSRSSVDEIDMTATLPTNRLSHSAARHKMAVRPKKKGPTRHRRTTMEVKFLFKNISN